MTNAIANDHIWAWPEEDRLTYYTMGGCHHLAVALADLTGFEMGILWNPFAWHVEPDEAGDGGVLELVHVYVVDAGGHVLDIRGRQTLDEMKRAMAGDDWEACPHEPLSAQRLWELINDSGNLVRFDSSDIAQAVEVVRRHPVLADIVRRRDPSFAPPPELDAAPPTPMKG